MANIVVLGELCEDILMHNPASVEVMGKKTWAKDITVNPGGSIFYTGTALKALGASVSVCSVVGDDPVGETMVHVLEDIGLDCSLIKTLPGVKFLEDVGQKLTSATRSEMVAAIRSASGRVIIGETVTFKQSTIDGVTNIELLKSWGCDMATINHYNVDFPMIPGMASTHEGVENFGRMMNAQGAPGIKPDTTVMEESFQNTFWQFGFGATIADVKRLAGIPVGMTLEPVDEDAGYPKARMATEENARRGAEQGASYITIIRTPKMSEDAFTRCVADVRKGMEEKGLVKAGKMPWGGAFLNQAEQFVTESEIRQLAEAGADVIVLPSPGTVPGLTIEVVSRWVRVVHECGLLAETTIGTSQEGADPDVIRRFAIDSKMTGADLFQIGDSVYGGCCVPENVMAFARAIKGQRHTLRRAALSPYRGE